MILAERDVSDQKFTFILKISGLDNVYEMVLYYALVAGILSCNNMIFTYFYSHHYFSNNSAAYFQLTIDNIPCYVISEMLAYCPPALKKRFL